MSQHWITSYVQSGLRFARRNGGKIALFTLAAGSAIAATTYVRRQFSVVNESLEQERTEGARKLRATFIANTQTVRTAFRALLPVAREILSGAERVNSSSFLDKLRSRPKDRTEKQELWEGVKLASVTSLVSSVYIAALLYSFLSLQMNLLARYTNSSLDAPVQALPSGLLSSATSKRFLDLARRKILDRDRVDAIVQCIESVVKANIHEIGLTERVGLVEVECLFANVLSAMETEGSLVDSTEGSSTPFNQSKSNPLSFPQQWLFTEDLGDSEDTLTNNRDFNYEWLVQESLDLCEVLDFHSVVESNEYIVLSYALSSLKEELGSSEVQLPFAHFLARFDSLASSVFAPPNDDAPNEDVNSPLLPRNSLEQLLSEAEDSVRFAASVFLSGEKENARNQHPHQLGQTDVDRESADHPVITNVSEEGEAVGATDLGLMFDIR